MNQIAIASIVVFMSGVFQPVQATLNGKASLGGLGAGWASSFSALTTGLVLAIATGLFSRQETPRPEVLLNILPTSLSAGILGAIILGGMTFSVTTLGTLQTFLVFFSAIAVSSLVIDLTGVLGTTPSALSIQQAGGALLIVVGIVLLRTSR